MLFVIHAYDNIYGGLHGMESKIIVDVDNEEEAEKWAIHESRHVIESESIIMDEFVEEALFQDIPEGTEDWYVFIEDCILDDIGYKIWTVTKDILPINELEEEFYNDTEEFIKKHCDKEVM